MSGRENYRIFNKFGRRNFIQCFTKRIPWKEIYIDNIGPIICLFRPHNLWQCNDPGEKPQFACKTCGRYIKSPSKRDYRNSFLENL